MPSISKLELKALSLINRYPNISKKDLGRRLWWAGIARNTDERESIVAFLLDQGLITMAQPFKLHSGPKKTIYRATAEGTSLVEEYS